MRIYLICPVRNATFDSSEIVRQLESDGHTVHFPPRDVDQSDSTGIEICKAHLQAMKDCDRVCVVWDVNSKGSHFDLGMAFALHKDIELLKALQPDTDGKSYLKVMKVWY
jgi:hypothetical protein